jgi:uroporphyrinogen-III synthase
MAPQFGHQPAARGVEQPPFHELLNRLIPEFLGAGFEFLDVRRIQLRVPLVAAGKAVVPMPLGADVVELPVIDFVQLAFERPEWRDYQWAIFTSANSVDYFFKRMAAVKGPKICAIGPATADALRGWGLRVAAVPEEYVAESLVDRLRPDVAPGDRVLVARAAVTRDVLVRELRGLGAVVDEVPAYRTRAAREHAAGLGKALAERRVDVVTFTSSSTVKNLCALFPRADLGRLMDGVAVASIGPITRATAAGFGLDTHIMPIEYTIPALARAIAAYFAEGRS